MIRFQNNSVTFKSDADENIIQGALKTSTTGNQNKTSLEALNGSNEATISVSVDNAGLTRTEAPSPSDTSNDKSIATTEWVKARIAQASIGGGSAAPDLSNYVDLSSTQTITGAKTFSAVVKAKTPATDSDDASVATTAWVKAKVSNLETAKQELSNKCNEALSQAKAYTDQEKAKYLPLTGGTLTGSLTCVASNSIADVNNKAITSYIADITEANSQLSITKGDGTSSVLSIGKVQNAATADNASNLGGYPSTNYVRSINNISPDENGNVEITTSGADLSGVVKSVNGIQPDESGSVTLEIPSTDGLVKSVNSITPDADGNVNISSNGTNIVGVTNNRNLGEIFTSSVPIESSQVHSLDGSVLTDSTELYDYLESLKDSNPNLFTTDSEFNSEVETTGKCSKFVINTDTKSVRIPKGDSNNYIVIKNYDTKFEFNQPFSLLEPKWSDVPLNNLSWLLSNGQVNSAENYPSVYELLLNEYNNGTLKSETIGDVSISFKQLDNGHKIVTDKTAYESILKNTGTAWYYLLDLDSRTFILPQTNGYMKYGNSNQFIKQSLPNIKGQTAWTMSSGDDNTTPPFEKLYVSPYGTVSGNGSSYPAKFVRIGFDASTCSDIYSDGANVNPNSVQGYLYFYVGDCVGTSNSVNLGDIKDKLDLDIANLKSDVTELNNLKGNISTYAFPSEKNVVLTIPTSKTTLTAPANGWFVYQSTGGGTTNDYMYMQNNTTMFYGCQTRDLGGRGVYVTCPAKKGESVYFEWVDSGAPKSFKFVYATDQNVE